MNAYSPSVGNDTVMPDDFRNFLMILRDTLFSMLALMVNPDISEERRKGISEELTVLIDQVDAILAREKLQ